MSGAIVTVEKLSHRYGERTALREVSFSVPEGQIFGFVGPNGGGKTTLFKILSSLLPPQEGRAAVMGFDLATHWSQVRAHLGVVFQSPSLDKKLTVEENMRHQGHLHGLSGNLLTGRISDRLERFRLADRKKDLVETLSGGLQRRVEIAKALLHEPKVLLLDEPSTGLDPGARRDIWDHLTELSQRTRLTVLVTTHLMEEADQCHQVAILNEGNLVALGEPSRLKESIGGDVITLEAEAPEELAKSIQERFQRTAQVVDGTLRLELKAGHEFIPKVVEAFSGKIRSVRLSKPSLEDVFIHKTGRRFYFEKDTKPKKK